MQQRSRRPAKANPLALKEFDHEDHSGSLPRAQCCPHRSDKHGRLNFPRAHEAARDVACGVHRIRRLMMTGFLGPLLGSLAMIGHRTGPAPRALNMWYEADIDAVMTRHGAAPILVAGISLPGSARFGTVICCGAVSSLA